MPKVLVFTYHWPPAAGPGVQRMLKFCKFLPSFGWEPTVITVKNAAFSSLDDSLADDVSESIVVHKTKTFEPFALYNLLKGKKGKHVPMGLIGLQNSKSFFQRISIYLRANYFIPDARKGWNKYAIAKADELFKKEKFDAIITTGPPHSTHLIGLHLNKKYGIPWVADLRDPWTNVYYNKFFPRTENTCKKDKKLEDSVVQNADLVTVVSDGLKDEFQSRAKNIAVIYNGYDDEDLHAEQQEKTTEKFTLAYVGNLKPNQNVPALWEVIRAAAAENEEFASNFQLNFTGNADDSVVESVQQQQLQEMLTRKGYVPHKEATAIMHRTNLLLFIVPQCENNHLILTGKLFEYIATGRPMLAIGPVNGNAAKLISNAGRDKMIDYKDKEMMKEQLLNNFQRWKEEGQKLHQLPSSNIQQYSRKAQTQKLSEILNQMVEK